MTSFSFLPKRDPQTNLLELIHSRVDILPCYLTAIASHLHDAWWPIPFSPWCVIPKKVSVIRDRYPFPFATVFKGVQFLSILFILWPFFLYFKTPSSLVWIFCLFLEKIVTCCLQEENIYLQSRYFASLGSMQSVIEFLFPPLFVFQGKEGSDSSRVSLCWPPTGYHETQQRLHKCWAVWDFYRTPPSTSLIFLYQLNQGRLNTQWRRDFDFSQRSWKKCKQQA